MSTNHSTKPSRLDDLTILIAVTLAAAIALLLPGVPWLVEWAVGIPLLFWTPGYPIVAALFPTAPRRSSTDDPHPIVSTTCEVHSRHLFGYICDDP